MLLGGDERVQRVESFQYFLMDQMGAQDRALSPVFKFRRQEHTDAGHEERLLESHFLGRKAQIAVVELEREK